MCAVRVGNTEACARYADSASATAELKKHRGATYAQMANFCVYLFFLCGLMHCAPRLRHSARMISSACGRRSAYKRTVASAMFCL